MVTEMTNRTCSTAYEISSPELREQAIEGIREVLAHVLDDVDQYIPEAVILEGAKLTIEIDLGRSSHVHTDFRHMVRE